MRPLIQLKLTRTILTQAFYWVCPRLRKHSVGFEYSQQSDIATDKASTEWAGNVVYSDLKEQKIRIGYQVENTVPYIFYGTGDLEISWSGYPDSDPNPLVTKLTA